MERPHIFTHIYSFSSFCDIIFIGFSFDDEKEKLFVLVEEREKISAATHTPAKCCVASVNFDVEREQLTASGGKKVR